MLTNQTYLVNFKREITKGDQNFIVDKALHIYKLTISILCLQAL